MMNEDRRQSENTALRSLVDALKTVISARDDMWSLSVVDRLFRLQKYKKTLADYDDAMQGVRNAIQSVVVASRNAQQESLPPIVMEKPEISLAEFEVLLGKPGAQKTPKSAMSSSKSTLSSAKKRTN